MMPSRSSVASVHLLGGPYVVCSGEVVPVPEGSKRLLAFVTLRGGRVDRRHAAGVLWPTGTDGRAAGNLRSSLWRLRSAGIDVLVDSDRTTVCLGDDVDVDVDGLRGWADRVIDGTAAAGDLAWRPPAPEALDLLPGWYDDWTVLERERLRQRVLHALEAQSVALSRRGRYADSVEAALVAVNAEPLRESAQRVLVAAHLREGNWIEAHRALSAYVQVLADELGAIPSEELTRWVHESGPAPVS